MNKEKDKNKKDWQKFGLMIGITLFIVGIYLLHYGRGLKVLPYLIAIGAIFIVMALLFPKTLSPIYNLWMRLSGVLNQVFTKIILVLTFYLLFMPISFLLKVFKKDLLDQKIGKEAKSYWQKVEKISDKLRYEKQF